MTRASAGGSGTEVEALTAFPLVELFSAADGAATAAADDARAALQKEFLVANGEHSVRLSLSLLDLRHSPISIDIGPAMRLDDLVATTVAALINRRGDSFYYGLISDQIRRLREQLAQ